MVSNSLHRVSGLTPLAILTPILPLPAWYCLLIMSVGPLNSGLESLYPKPKLPEFLVGLFNFEMLTQDEFKCYNAWGGYVEGETHCFLDSKVLGEADTEPGRCDAKMWRSHRGVLIYILLIRCVCGGGKAYCFLAILPKTPSSFCFWRIFLLGTEF